MLFALLKFSESLATKCVSLNNESCTIRSGFFYLNPIERNCYQFIISLDKYNGICNVIDYLSTKICAPSETKDVNVKVFNMITRIKEVETFVKHISCDCKCKLDSTN